MQRKTKESRYWPNEVKQDLKMAPHWSAQKWHKNQMILLVFLCRNSSLDCYDAVKVHREDDGAVHHDQVIDECKKKQADNAEYRSVERKKDFVNAPLWSIEKWKTVLAKGGGQKERFQFCLKPDETERLLSLRAVQCHSGRAHSGNAPIDPLLQDNVLIPMTVTK